MAAISNQNVEWKQAAMQKAERLTDYWDIVKAWAGRAAEIVLTVCMFAQLIGMLPGVNYPTFVNNTILGVQIIMLDFGAFALAPLVEHARQIGQEQAAQKAENMATFLVRLVILTVVLIIIGQFAPVAGRYAWLVTAIVKYSEPVLILVRVGCVVKYIHVIHSLRSTTSLAIQPTAQPAQQVDYAEIARQLLPTLRDELRQIVPDTTGLVEQVQQIRVNVEELAAKSVQQSEQVEDTREDSEQTPIVNITEYRNEQSEDAAPDLQLSPKVTQKLSTKKSIQVSTQKASGTAQERALRTLKKHPQIRPSELAKRAQISRSYASKILAERA